MVSRCRDFFNYSARNFGEEIRSGFLKAPSTEGLGHFCSLRGRAVCAYRTFAHAVGCIAKPIIYRSISSESHQAVQTWRHLSRLTQDEVNQLNHQTRFKWDPVTYAGNPEWIQRMEERSHYDRFCQVAPAMPLNQAIQMVRASLGVIHPGIYFENDLLDLHVKALAIDAKEAGCSLDLIDRLERGSAVIRKLLDPSQNKEYYELQIVQDLGYIREQFRDPQFPLSRKFTLLSLLNPDPEGSGIEACPPVLTRTLQQIRLMIELPSDPKKIMPALVGRFKAELINQMILQTENTKYDLTRPDWHTLIRQLAHDEGHRGNALIVTLGSYIGLPEAIIERACQDPVLTGMKRLSANQLEMLLRPFYALCSEEAIIKSLLDQINSKEDGSPGLRVFRDYMSRVLIENVSDEDLQKSGDTDPTMHVVKSCYLREGTGSPSDEGFNDFNEFGIRAFCNTLGFENPLVNFALE